MALSAKGDERIPLSVALLPPISFIEIYLAATDPLGLAVKISSPTRFAVGR